MLVDNKLVLCNSASIPTGTTQVAVGDVLDLGIGLNSLGESQNPNIGEGGNVWLNILCDGLAFTVAATVRFYTGDTPSVTSGTELLQAAAPATLKDGEVIARVKLPAGDIKRYVGIAVTPGTASGAGKITAWLSDHSETPALLKQ